MTKNLKAFAIVSPDRSYGKRLKTDLLALCRENGCNFLFRTFSDRNELQSCIELDTFTHIILVSEFGGSRVVKELRNSSIKVPIMLLTKSSNDMQALFCETDAYCAKPPQSKEDFAHIMNLLYGCDNRFLPEGRQLRILSLPCLFCSWLAR